MPSITSTTIKLVAQMKYQVNFVHGIMPRVCRLIGMSLCALVLSRVICLLFWLLIFILVYCSVCVSKCILHYIVSRNRFLYGFMFVYICS